MTEQRLHSKEAEDALLSLLMHYKDSYEVILPAVRHGDFYHRNNHYIFGLMRGIIDEHGSCDHLLVRDSIRQEGRLDDTLKKHLHAIFTQNIGLENAELYAKRVAECAQRRRIKGAAEEILRKTLICENNNDLIVDAEKELYNATKISSERDLVSVADFIESVGFGGENYISTGFNGIDAHIYGLREADMIVVAGRPGSGKTSLALNIAANVASQGTPIGIFSLEMTAVQLQQRLICSKAKVNLSDALTGRLTLAHNTDIQRAKNWLKNYPIFIDDNPYLSPEVLRRKVLRMINRHGVKAIVIDYLQLMRSKGNSLHEKVTYISQAVKGIALEYSVPIIVLAQLNRQPEAREDGEPRVSDLRDSGSIEQDADIVMLIHRVDLYQGTNTGDTKIIVGKNRRGHTGFVPATYLGDYTLFIEQ
jgi:replicative DNA helicase